MTTEKLRILCLHGYLQNADVFSQKAGSVRKALKAKAELIFVTAPHAIALTDTDPTFAKAASAADNPHGWWTWKEEVSGTRPSTAAAYQGVDCSLSCLTDVWLQQAPFDGILGFSQGATMAVLFLAHLAKTKPALLPQFCVLAAGFLPRDPAWAETVNAVANLPLQSLVVHGDQDKLVPMDRSQQLQTAMGAACTSTYIHSGGHMIPTASGDFRQLLLQFLTQYTSRGQSEQMLQTNKS